jgi:lipopolysaccharide export LptBFGC system permease protein LptF
VRVDRRGRIAPAAAAALLALTAYLAGSSGASALTRLGGLPVGVATWAVPTLFALLGALVFPRRPR